MIEMIVQRLRLFIEILDEGVDVVLAARAVEAAFIECRVEALAKDIRLVLDAVNDLFDLFVGDAVRNITGDRRCNIAATPTPGDVVSRSQLLEVRA